MFHVRGSVKQSSLLKTMQYYFPVRLKIEYDRSKIPVLNENDLEEKFIKGGGPGGQKVNKTNSCVQLLHKPTGIIVKCQEVRDKEQNRKLARERLITKLDNLYNGENSLENQKKRILEKKRRDKERKRQQLLELRQIYKEIDNNKKNDT